ncbi:MAG: hypothetical protein V3S16_07165 [Candidatus Desulfatibia sp.]|uniref:hypothetical protein n=1 Tax=Candidatus Desulfatibia sp. TaxID=3101189 RepID=UPI002F339BD6
MAQVSPSKLVLKCYGSRLASGGWHGICLNFNLAAEAETVEELRSKLHEMIESYIETVLDTSDADSVPALLSRRAPILDWLNYYFIRLVISFRDFPGNITFKELIPFHLSSSC